MEKKLPSYIVYDLEGYRGFGIVKFPLCIKKVDNFIVGSYAHDGAGYGLYTEVGCSREEVVDKLYKKLVYDGYIED